MSDRSLSINHLPVPRSSSGGFRLARAPPLAARERLAQIAPIMNEGLCLARMAQTTAARQVLDAAGAPPLGETDATEQGLDDIGDILE